MPWKVWKRDEALALVAERDARIAQARKRLDQIAFDPGERLPAGGVVATRLFRKRLG